MSSMQPACIYAKIHKNLLHMHIEYHMIIQTCGVATYRIAGNFDGGNFNVFDAFQPDRQNLTRQIFKAIQCLVKDSDHPSKYILSNI